MTGFGIKWLSILLMLFGLSTAARAEMIEVAPGVQVTKTTYDAPADEQPFYGFTTKTAEQRAADAKLVVDLVAAAGSRQKAFDAVMMRGWKAVTAGRAAEACRRFNQAFLLAPEQSSVYHGFAMVVQMRFNDLVFADELFRRSRQQPHPLKALNTDYGRLLLMGKHFREAQPVLEQAIVDTPDVGDAWGYLAFARLQNGDKAGACTAAGQASNRKPSRNTVRDLVLLKKDAQCN